MTTITGAEGRILRAAQTALSEAATQFKSDPAAVGNQAARTLSLDEVVGQLKIRRDSQSDRSVLPANAMDIPELTPPSARAMLLAANGAASAPTATTNGAGRSVQAGGKSGPMPAAKFAAETTASRSRPAATPSAAAAAAVSQSQADSVEPPNFQGAAALRYWIAEIQQQVDSTTEAQLIDTLERFKKSNKAQREFQEKKAEEVQKKEEAAQKASQIMGCLAKIVGAVVVAASVVSAAFTGGSSLILAGLGLALMAADAIAEKVTGESITGRLLSPLIQKVFAPLAKLMGDVIASVLKKLNVSDDIADLVGAISGAIAAAIAVVAVAILTKSAQIGKFVGKLVAPLMKSVAKMMPKVISTVASKLSSVMAKLMAKADGLSNTLTRNSTRLLQKVGMGTAEAASMQATRAALVGGAVNGTAQAGFTGWMAFNSNEIEKAGAELTVLFADMDQLRRGLDLSVTHWQEQLSRTASLDKIASDAMQSAQNTQLFILGNTRRAAAL